ncbi:MAG: hypothetical protein R6U91_08265 [Bacillota bacterium]
MIFWVIFIAVSFTIMALIYIYMTRDRFKTVDSFLTARGTLTTGVAMATVLASIMGAWILFSPAEAGTWGGLLAFGGYAVAQALAVMLFAVIGPRLRKIAPKGSTLTEFVYYRYGIPMYIITLICSVFYMSIFLAAELTGIALSVNLITDLPLWLTALLIGVGTLIYTTYGGIRGSIFTDSIQAIIMIPTLLIAFFATVYFLGGFGDIILRAQEVSPNLLGFGHWGGWEFAITLLIAVIAANAFHAGFWSRVFAAKDDSTVRKSFIIAGLLVIPIMMLAGFFGIMWIMLEEPAMPSAALFEVVLSATPSWVVGIVITLGIALVMSSVDTVINGIANVFTVDLARFKKNLSPENLKMYARIITALICLAVIAIASQGYSVLYLFFIADLVCAAALVPLFYGLYSNRFPGWAAALSTIIGLFAGATFFPDPTFTRGNLLLSFAVALVIPAVLTLILSRFGKPISFDELSKIIGDVPNVDELKKNTEKQSEIKIKK